MSRGPDQRIADILEAIERCQSYLDALSSGSDVAQMAEDAIERNLQIIGEAAKSSAAKYHRCLSTRAVGADSRLPQHFGTPVLRC